jgi:AAA+ ATPase superfamily predicted ATPase
MEQQIIGRKNELDTLSRLYNSSQSEFVAVYGRRRVGKTFLIRQFFKNKFVFQLSGLANASTKEQLINFNLTIKRESKQNLPIVKTWLEAFEQLIALVEASTEERKVIFLDELPWIDTPRSQFVQALEHFWNGWASARNDIMLIVCGSATSWMIDKIINNHGGLHNRLTYKMRLEPFTLKETQEYFLSRGMEYSQYQIAECYMAMGGIPYYLSMMQKEFSVAQNIDLLFFGENSLLKNEFQNLYAALFKNSEDYIKIVEALSKKNKGLSRNEIIAYTKLLTNGGLTTILKNLENCGFIRSYIAFGKKERDKLYQLVDFYTLFYFKFVKSNRYNDENFWINTINTPQHNSWAGYSFEMLCLNHIKQIKASLGISGVQTSVSSWKDTSAENGAQIDLILDRKDQIINLCEMKFSIDEYEITKQYDAQLRQKKSVFSSTTKTRKALHLTMVTTYGVKRNMYSNTIQNEVVLEDLFQ